MFGDTIARLRAVFNKKSDQIAKLEAENVRLTAELKGYDECKAAVVDLEVELKACQTELQAYKEAAAALEAFADDLDPKPEPVVEEVPEPEPVVEEPAPEPAPDANPSE